MLTSAKYFAPAYYRSPPPQGKMQSFTSLPLHFLVICSSSRKSYIEQIFLLMRHFQSVFIGRASQIRQNQRMRLRYTDYSSRSAARVGPRTHVILPLHKRPPKITTLWGNLSVCRQHNILYNRNNGFANKLTKQCSS